IRAGADSSRHPTSARFKHNLVNRRSADAKEDIVMHLKTFDSFESLDGRTHLTLPKDEGVVNKPIPTLCFAGAITSDSGHTRSLSRDMLEDVSYYVGIFSRSISVHLLIAMGVWTN